MAKKTFKSIFVKYKKIVIKIILKRKYIFLLGVSLFSMMSILLLRQKTAVSGEWKGIADIKPLTTFLKENPKMDNENIIKPDYATCFKRWKRGYWDLLQETFGIKKALPWKESQFISLLERVTKQRNELGFVDDTIIKMQLQEGARVIVIGNLQGAFHSLVRDIEELIKMNIISADLKVIKETDMLFCTGDAINRSPYSIETMSVLMRLLEENPDQFFYIQGNHEDNNYWKDYTLKQELKMKISGGSGDSIPLEDEVNAFFETLPIAWYGEILPVGSKKFLRISHEGLDYPQLKESQFKNFLIGAYDKKVSKFQVESKNVLFTGEPSPLIGFIRAEKKRKTYQTMDGMRMLPPEEGIVGWTVLSCPTKIYQLGIKFFYDAFAIVECGNQVAEWTITLYNQDIRIKNGFSSRTHNFLSGSLSSGSSAPSSPNEAVIQQQEQVSSQPVVQIQKEAVVVVESAPKKLQQKQVSIVIQPEEKIQQASSQQSEKVSVVVEEKVIPQVPGTEQEIQKTAKPVKQQVVQHVAQKQAPIPLQKIEKKQDLVAKQKIPVKQVPSIQPKKPAVPAIKKKVVSKTSSPVQDQQVEVKEKLVKKQLIQKKASIGQVAVAAEPTIKKVATIPVVQKTEVVVQFKENSDEISMVKQPGVHEKEEDDNLKGIVVKEIKEDEDDKKEEVVVDNPAVLISREEIEPIAQPPIADALPVNPAEANVTANMSN